MQNKAFLYGIIGFLLGAGLVWFGASGSGQGFTQNKKGEASVMDAHFIEQMIPHHEDAIVMAKLALEKSKKQEIKDLSKNIIDSQSKEIELMKSWYKSWYGKEVPQGSQIMGQHGMRGGGMHMGKMGDMTDTKNLEKAENFDKAFIEEMIPHHQMAVMMANMLKNGTKKPEMKQLADDIISAQTKEIDQMRTWYKTWGY